MTTPRIRELAYADRFVENLITDNGDGLSTATPVPPLSPPDTGSHFVFPDKTSPQTFIVDLSENQFTQIYTALLNGVDLTYPDNADEVLFAFLAMVDEYMALCDAIADCIATSTITQDALDQYLAATGQNGGAGNSNAPLASSVLNGDLIPSGTTCNDDHMYAQAIEVVRWLDRNSTDFFEIVEAVTNGAEYATILSDNGGVFGSIPASAAETAAWLQDTIAETYAAAYTAQTEETFACEIFCAIKDNCTMSIEDIYNAYQSAISVTIPNPDDLQSVLSFLVGIVPMVDDVIVGSVHLLILSLLRFGSSWVNTNSFGSLRTALEASKDDTNSGHSACGCSTEQTIVVTWDAGGYPDYSNEQGSVASGGNPDNCLYRNETGAWVSSLVAVRIDLLAEYTVTEVKGDIENKQPQAVFRVKMFDSTDTVVYNVAPTPATPSGWNTLSQSGLSVGNVRYVEVWMGNTTNQSGGNIWTRMDNVTVTFE